MILERVSLLSLLVLFAGAPEFRGQENVAKARGTARVNPIRQRQDDPGLRSKVIQAGRAEYIAPSERRQQLIQDMEKAGAPIVREHEEFLQEHDCRPEAFREFARRIQPILFNSCSAGACHGGNAKGFELQRPRYFSQTTAALTRQNFVSTLSWVYKNDPEASPLLEYALTPHGGASRSPLLGPSHSAYRVLKEWVMQTASGHTQALQPGRVGETRRTGPGRVIRADYTPDGTEGPNNPDPTPLKQRFSPQVREVPIRRIDQRTLNSGTLPEKMKKDQTGKNGRPRSSFFQRIFDRNRPQ